MGFLRRLFGGKKSGLSAGGPDKSGSEPGKNKRRWCFSKQGKYKSETDATTSSAPINDPLDANNHAIAVAAATAAAAEAALAAAHAAAEVVRLTSSSGSGAPSTSTSLPDSAVHSSESQHQWPEEIAAVKIQSAFRGYLAKRALRALRALVKLQALVRGHIVRKQTADLVRRMQTLVRLQSRARASRVHLPDTLHSRYYALSRHPIPEDYEHPLSTCSTRFDGSSVLKRCRSNANYRDIGSERARFGSNWFNHCIEESVWNHPRDDEKSDKILEVDTWKPHFTNENFMAYDPLSKPSTKPLSQKSLSSMSFRKGKEEIASRTAEHSPQTFSAGNGARRSPFITPTKSECSWGFFSGYSGHPNYMANTESSRAKVRSQSAPRQRLWNADFRSQSFAASSRFNRIGSTILR